jgi:hypothetical protein
MCLYFSNFNTVMANKAKQLKSMVTREVKNFRWPIRKKFFLWPIKEFSQLYWRERNVYWEVRIMTIIWDT